MAVSKTRFLEEIEDAYEAGFRLFGENHVQEIVAKFSDYRPQDLELHMIGHLQSNKVSKVVPLVDMIESVDSLSLLEKIDLCASSIGKVIDVLLEVNTSGEASKSGFQTQDELFDCIRASLGMKNIRLRGLMTVGPVSCDPKQSEKAFSVLCELKAKCKELVDSPCFDILSMGMSSDYRTALAMGSTEVRIGTAIFGERHYA